MGIGCSCTVNGLFQLKALAEWGGGVKSIPLGAPSFMDTDHAVRRLHLLQDLQ